MQLKLESISDWLTQSELKVNEDKTELCMFQRKDQPTISVTFKETFLTSKPNINVLGVAFDSKLNWQIQVQNAIAKSNKSLHAIKLTTQ